MVEVYDLHDTDRQEQYCIVIMAAASSASGSAHVASADSPILLHLGHFSSSLASGVPHAGQVHSEPFFLYVIAFNLM